MYYAYIIYCDLMNSLGHSKRRISYAASAVILGTLTVTKLYAEIAQLSQERG